eukprot:COSAG02_NODE_552_length_20429_cov_28.014068_9_plen_545_part_00
MEVGKAIKSDLGTLDVLASSLEAMLQPAVHVGRVLQSGGDDADLALQHALEHALEITDTRISETPRRTRAVLADRLEALVQSIPSKVRPKVCEAEAGVLAELAEQLVAVNETDPDNATSSDVATITALVNALEQYTVESVPPNHPQPEPELVLNRELKQAGDTTGGVISSASESEAAAGAGRLQQVRNTLEHAVELCEGKTIGTPRRMKFDVAERLETALELIEEDTEHAVVQLEGEGQGSQVVSLCEEICSVQAGKASKTDVNKFDELAAVLEAMIQPEVQMSRTLQAGGDAAEQVLQAVVEHALELTDARIAGTPRRTRASLADRLESILDATATIVQLLCQEPSDALEALAKTAAAVNPIHSDSVSGADIPKICALVEALERYAATQPVAEPQTAPDGAALMHSFSNVPAGDHPLFRALEAHQLEAQFEKLLELGVKRVEDLEHMNESDVQQLGMLKFDHAKFVSAFITETPHHGVPTVSRSSGAAAVEAGGGGFSFEGGKHAMFSYNWDDQSVVVRVREHFQSLGVPTWMDIDGGMKVCL